MKRPVKCNAGNKRCGNRCVPESYTCASDRQVQSEDAINSEVSLQRLSSSKSSVPNKREVTTSRSEALDIQYTRQQEAYALAGGKSEYKKELAKILNDTGAGIRATLTRDVMRLLSPNLIKADDINLYLQVKKTGAYEKQAYNPDRKKFKMSDIIREGDVLKKGDIIRVRFPTNAIAGGFGYHYGVYIGNGRMIQYNKIRREKGKKRSDTQYAGVHESHLKDANKEGMYKWEKVVSTNTYSPEELQARMDKVKDTKIKYNLMKNNCEHFSYLLTTGKAYSSQADVGGGPIARVIQLYFMYFQNQVLRKKAGLGDKKYNTEFKALDNLSFSESKDTFKYPTSIVDVADAFTKAITFAKFMDPDPNMQIKILSSWMQQYLYQLTY